MLANLNVMATSKDSLIFSLNQLIAQVIKWKNNDKEQKTTKKNEASLNF